MKKILLKWSASNSALTLTFGLAAGLVLNDDNQRFVDIENAGFKKMEIRYMANIAGECCG